MTHVTMVIFIILNRKGVLWLPRFFQQILMNGFLLLDSILSLFRVHAINPSYNYEKRMSPINLAWKKPCDV